MDSEVRTIHLRGHETVDDLRRGLNSFIGWYNDERGHSSLGYNKPGQLYFGEVKLPGE